MKSGEVSYLAINNIVSSAEAMVDNTLDDCDILEKAIQLSENVQNNSIVTTINCSIKGVQITLCEVYL